MAGLLDLLKKRLVGTPYTALSAVAPNPDPRVGGFWLLAGKYTSPFRRVHLSADCHQFSAHDIYPVIL